MDTNQSYNAVFSVRFMATTVLACSFIAFSLGRIARLVVLPEFPQEENQFVRIDQESKNNLPTPLAKGGKLVPETIYTARVFDTRRSFSMSSQWLQKEETEDSSSDDDLPVPKNEKLAMLNETDVAEFMDEEEHLPAGQHLLVDIDGLDESFLDSEKRLATAMIQLVDMSGLTLLSYHCHGLTPAGVSCAGVLLESHVAFHTWPKEGVITLDLFTCGSTSLLNHLHLIENLFIVPRNEVETPNVLWAYKRRGFKSQFTNPGSRDTFAYPLGLHGLGMKKQVGGFCLFVCESIKRV
jgi:S-adenosylmethionine decarboxylase proenzyme